VRKVDHLVALAQHPEPRCAARLRREGYKSHFILSPETGESWMVNREW
jgi:hypothetical protein